MFWDKNYTPSQNIEALLKKENVTVEEFLDEDDIIQECKSQKKALLNYFMRPDVIRRLVELTLTEPPEELPVAQRFRHANVACELLTLGLPSLDEKLLADADTLKLLYSYLENQPPLNPLLASFFSKTFRTLFTKKSDQDWFLYQQMCLKLLEYLKLQNNFLDLICKHFTTPVIPDLIMQMMRNVEGGQLKRSLYDWLNAEGLVEKLIRILAESEECEKHANVSEFLCDLIQQGRTMRQTEDSDSFEPAFDGSNPILKNIESAPTLEALFNVILQPNAQESAIVSGITVVLKIIKPIVIVDERNSDRLKFLQDRERKIHEDLLKTVICVIEPHLKHFNELLRNPPKKPDIVISAATLSPPFGMTRLQICRLFTVLLQTNNEDISKAICETDFFETLLYLFKQYCWNNFLHSEVEKCLQIVFYNSSANYSNNISNIPTQVIDSLQNRRYNLGDNVFDNNSDNIFNIKQQQQQRQAVAVYCDIEDRRMGDGLNVDEDRKQERQRHEERKEEELIKEANSEMAMKTLDDVKKSEEQSSEGAQGEFVEVLMESNVNVEQFNASTDVISTENIGDNNKQELTKASVNTGPSNLQTHVIVNCKIISKLMDCWQHNRDVESMEKGRRLGYMGHLIQIFKHIINCISESENIGALIEANFQSDAERELWHTIMNNDTGDLTRALKDQSQLLANCNAHEACDYNITLDFLTDTDLSDAFIMMAVIMMNAHDGQELINNNFNLLQFDDDDEDENATGGEGLSIYGKSSALLSPFTATSNPWEMNDDFNMLRRNSGITAGSTAHWATDIAPDNFADFDAHFSSFSNELGEGFGVSTGNNIGNECVFSNETGGNANKIGSEGYDNNANVEKPGWPAHFLRLQMENDAEYLATNLMMDDYEDDEGMWTRPLGMPPIATEEHLRKAASQLQQLSMQTAATNGPSKDENQDPDDEKEGVSEDNGKLNNSLEEDNMLKTNPTFPLATAEAIDEDDTNEFNLEAKPSMHKLNTLDIENKFSNINSSVTDEEAAIAAADVKDNVTIT
uniref:Uncharacterized protein n=1 Tax=Glossina brevipalpis TaxID=37001 RepID=A0A1A9W4X9_9MUSC